MALHEIVVAAASGGVATALFGWLRSRGAQSVTAEDLARKALADQLDRYERQLTEASARLEAALARADAAELRAEAEAARRIASESEADRLRAERDALLDRLNGLRQVVEGAVARITSLESERNEAHRELARRADDAERERVAGTVETTASKGKP